MSWHLFNVINVCSIGFWTHETMRMEGAGGGYATLKCRLSEIDFVFIPVRFSKFTQHKVAEATSVNKHISHAVTVGLSLICIFRIAFIMIGGKHVSWFGRAVVCSVGWFVGSVGWLAFCKIEPCCYLSAMSCCRLSCSGIKARVFAPAHAHTLTLTLRSLQLKSKYDQAMSTHQPSSQVEWMSAYSKKEIGTVESVLYCIRKWLLVSHATSWLLMALKFLYIFTERSQLLQSKIRITLTWPIISAHYHTYYFPVQRFFAQSFCSISFLFHSLSHSVPSWLIVFPAFIRTLLLNAEQIVVLWVNVQLNPQLYSIMQMITTIFGLRKKPYSPNW